MLSGLGYGRYLFDGTGLVPAGDETPLNSFFVHADRRHRMIR